ncbi:MAG: hypothetical protein ASARMPREDX12_006869 [Alectoria sarmentosa]|nr:MAG: hypothetical protein ASARMPREDX12_006869 [Alectoria sarmentosa]
MSEVHSAPPNSVAHPMPNKDENRSFPLMRLPLEIRLETYSYALVAPNRVILRRPQEMKFQNSRRYSIPIGINVTRLTSILRASREIYEESLPVFYGTNTFQTSTHPYEDMPWEEAQVPTQSLFNCRTQLSFMRHISIDWVRAYPLWSAKSGWTRWIDESIARVLNDVEKHLPKLKSLKLEVLSTSHFTLRPSFSKQVRRWESNVALKKLLDKVSAFTFVTLGPEPALLETLTAIAPATKWTKELHEEWPGRTELVSEEMKSFRRIQKNQPEQRIWSFTTGCHNNF